uniref:Uncharacterized protein n=1 Tax=Octactis speculum TaxID=3111310 RepID=A0A7S2G729_9STRA|mmetsp:Transcript_40518/g.55162  ORF Transcript_40518/g.55162 Transcript_40518/m.55162 type:complete len:370 (+) Transcript_40518:69-1178(+)
MEVVEYDENNYEEDLSEFDESYTYCANGFQMPLEVPGWSKKDTVLMRRENNSSDSTVAASQDAYGPSTEVLDAERLARKHEFGLYQQVQAKRKASKRPMEVEEQYNVPILDFVLAQPSSILTSDHKARFDNEPEQVSYTHKKYREATRLELLRREREANDIFLHQDDSSSVALDLEQEDLKKKEEPEIPDWKKKKIAAREAKRARLKALKEKADERARKIQAWATVKKPKRLLDLERIGTTERILEPMEEFELEHLRIQHQMAADEALVKAKKDMKLKEHKEAIEKRDALRYHQSNTRKLAKIAALANSPSEKLKTALKEFAERRMLAMRQIKQQMEDPEVNPKCALVCIGLNCIGSKLYDAFQGTPSS